MTTSIERLLSTREAAELLGVTQQTMRRWRSRGIGPPYVTISSNRKGYEGRDIEEWKERRKFDSVQDEVAARAIAAHVAS